MGRVADDDVIIDRVATIDVGKAEVACCARTPGQPDGRGRRGRVQEVRKASTMTRPLHERRGLVMG